MGRQGASSTTSIKVTRLQRKTSAQPFQRAMATKYPDQRTFFASWNHTRDIKALSQLLVSMSPLPFGVEAADFTRDVSQT